MSFRVAQTLAPFGAELEGDLSAPLDEAGQASFRDALYRHGLLVARGQKLAEEDQARLLSHIGPILTEERGDARRIAPDGVLGAQALSFHSDLAFSPKPFEVISLHALDVVDGETATRFASGTRAYRNLPPPLKARVAGTRILLAHLFHPVGYDDPVPGWMPHKWQDAVMWHPVTGEPILYVTEQQTIRVETLAKPDSDALLAELGAFLYAPDNLYRHVWHQGDFLVWDNLALQHARGDLHQVKRRTLQRVCVAEATYLEQHPHLYDFFYATEETRKVDHVDPHVARWSPPEERNSR